EGYIDSTGKVVIEPRFDKGRCFTEGLACVNIGGLAANMVSWGERYRGGKWGYVDKTGQIVIRPQFDIAESFRGGLARVDVGGRRVSGGVKNPSDHYVDGNVGYIDRAGRYVWKPTK
ncbi:MAG: WG repeat-containing protein, partial [Planctomycetota bacterium]